MLNKHLAFEQAAIPMQPIRENPTGHDPGSPLQFWEVDEQASAEPSHAHGLSSLTHNRAMKWRASMCPMLEENDGEAQRDWPKVTQLRRGRGRTCTQAWLTQGPVL